MGTPVALLLQQRDATVTVVHSRTQNAKQIVLEADIIIAAIGKPEFVRGDWVKPGAAVIDVGTNPVPVRVHPARFKYQGVHAAHALALNTRRCLGCYKEARVPAGGRCCFP